MKRCAFCGRCGTRLYHTGARSDVFSMKAGSLDDTSMLAPTCHLWTRRAQPWMAPVLKRSPGYEEEPDCADTLLAQWREATR